MAYDLYQHIEMKLHHVGHQRAGGGLVQPWQLAVQVGGQLGESITARRRAAAPPAVPRQQTGGNRGWVMQ